MTPADAVLGAAVQAAGLEADARTQLAAAWNALATADCETAAAAARRAADIIDSIKATVTSAAAELTKAVT